MDAFEERLREVGGRAVMLGATMEIAACHGYPGGHYLAEGLPQLEGRFVVQIGPSGQQVVRRTDAALRAEILSTESGPRLVGPRRNWSHS